MKMEISPYQKQEELISHLFPHAIYHHFVLFHRMVPGTEFSRMWAGLGTFATAVLPKAGEAHPNTTVISGQTLAGLIRLEM